MLLYARIAWFNFATYFAYPLELAAAFVKPFINLSFTLLFWSIIAASSSGVVDFRHIVSYLLIASAITNTLLISDLGFGSNLAKAIKNGDISYALIKPVKVPLFYLASRIGSYGTLYCVSAALFAAGLIIQPASSPWSILLFALFLPAACVISYSINLLIGTIAIYFTEVSSIRNVIKHFINVFSGAIVPVSFFPGTLQSIVLFLPFASAVFGPVHALHTPQPTGQTWLVLASAYAWAGILFGLSWGWWRKSLRNYEAIGI